MNTTEPRLDQTVRDIADQIRSARPQRPGRAIFLIGAGCSVTAGIPGAAAIAKIMVKKTVELLGLGEQPIDSTGAYRLLVRSDRLVACHAGDAKAEVDDEAINWYAVYDNMFRRHYRTPDDVRALFDDLVTAANGAINWAHLCIGEIVARGFVSTVLTTNFDQLVLSGIVRAGILPVVCDGVESLNRISGAPRHPQLVELHGSRHTYLLRNSPEDVAAVATNSPAQTAIDRLLRDTNVFVAIGYGGREDGVMDLLIRAGRSYPDKNLIWVSHSADPAAIGPKVGKFLGTSRNNALLCGQDADAFFLHLCQEMSIGAPRAISAPLQAAAALIDAVERSDVENRDIRAEIDAARSRLDRLKELEPRSSSPIDAQIAAVREARLAGDFSNAYTQALQALSVVSPSEADPRLLEEAALAALEHGRTSAQSGPLEHAVTWFRTLLASTSSVDEKRKTLSLRLAEALTELGRRQTDRASLEDAVSLLKSVADENGGGPEQADVQDRLGVALFRLGERENNAVRLEQAVAALRAALTERTRTRVPLDWAGTQNNLGNALQTLGARESGTARLEEAVAAYRAALEEYTRTRVPLDWATTQSNLGAALQTLGARESGTERLEEAVAAYRAALEERTRTRVPLDWAMTQNNLGIALATLGARESGTARLEEAVAAYRAALEERTRTRVPLDWAMTQNNLGNALATLGERESGTARLEEAVAAYRAALEERTRTRVPLDWAMTQNNLGNALATLGERKSGTARLEEAVAAYRAALEEYTRTRVPLDWAMTQNNLGNALRTLGERESGTARLEEAVAAYRAALEERTRTRVPLDWAMTQNNLGNALATLGERESGTARLEEAVAAYRAALEERTRTRVPLDWAMTQNNLGNALATLGERKSGTARLEEAVAAYRAALEEYTRTRVPLDWAMTQNNLGNALRTLGERESGTARLEEAVAAYRAALEEYTRIRVPLDWAATQFNLSVALEKLGERRNRLEDRAEALACMRGAAMEYGASRDDYWGPIATEQVTRMEAAWRRLRSDGEAGEAGP